MSIFISVEGMDLVGKDTQIELIVKMLEGLGQRVKVIREFDVDDITRQLSQVFLKTEGVRNTYTDFYTISAIRQQSALAIELALTEYDVVIANRYIDSTLAIQGYAENGKSEMNFMSAMINRQQLPMPQYTLYLVSGDFDMLERRKVGRGQESDRIEDMDRAFQAKILEAYTYLATERRDNKKDYSYVVVEEGQSPMEIFHKYALDLTNVIHKHNHLEKLAPEMPATIGEGNDD